MSTVRKNNTKVGRPPEEPRVRMTLLVKPVVRKKIVSQMDAVRNSRGKVVESKFEN